MHVVIAWNMSQSQVRFFSSLPVAVYAIHSWWSRPIRKSNTSSCRANGAINLYHSFTFPVYCGPLFLVCFGVAWAVLCVAVRVCALPFFFSCSILKVLLLLFLISLYVLSLSCPPSFGFPSGIISDCHFKCHPLCLPLLFWSVTGTFFRAVFTSPSWTSDLKRSPVFCCFWTAPPFCLCKNGEDGR